MTRRNIYTHITPDGKLARIIDDRFLQNNSYAVLVAIPSDTYAGSEYTCTFHGNHVPLCPVPLWFNWDEDAPIYFEGPEAFPAHFCKEHSTLGELRVWQYGATSHTTKLHIPIEHSMLAKVRLYEKPPF